MACLGVSLCSRDFAGTESFRRKVAPADWGMVYCKNKCFHNPIG